MVGLALGPAVAAGCPQWPWWPGRVSRLEGFSAAPQGSQEKRPKRQSRGRGSPGVRWNQPGRRHALADQEVARPSWGP